MVLFQTFGLGSTCLYPLPHLATSPTVPHDRGVGKHAADHNSSIQFAMENMDSGFCVLQNVIIRVKQKHYFLKIFSH